MAIGRKGRTRARGVGGGRGRGWRYFLFLKPLITYYFDCLDFSFLYDEIRLSLLYF